MGEKRVIEQVASNVVHNDDWFLKDSPTQDTSKISATNLKAILGADGTQALSKEDNAIAEDYDSASTYNKDDFAFYENKLYRCLANNTTGTWDGTKWEEFDLPTALITTAHNIETAEFTIGTYYSADDLVLKDGKLYKIEGNGLQSEQAFKSGLSFLGNPIQFKLTDEWGRPIPEEKLYKPSFGPKCQNCGMRLTCNGCSRCGKCKNAG